MERQFEIEAMRLETVLPEKDVKVLMPGEPVPRGVWFRIACSPDFENMTEGERDEFRAECDRISTEDEGVWGAN